MMSVNFQIAFATDIQTEISMRREKIQHVVEKSNARINFRLAAFAVQFQFNFNLSFLCRAINFADSHCAASKKFFIAEKTSSFSMRVPIDTRRQFFKPNALGEKYLMPMSNDSR